MRVLSIHRGADTAGIGWLLSDAFRGTKVEFRSVVRRQNYIAYPQDYRWDDAAQQWRLADVVHLHNSFGAWSRMGADKPFVLHHHGTYYRQHADVLNAAVAEHGGVAVVSTLDLLGYGDDLTWCPAPYDLDWLAGFRKPREGRLRIGHAPTDRAIKSTDAFLSACERVDVEPVLIERKRWAECLALKSTCDVYFDQVQLGYGHNAIEAWGMGIPVIAGADDATLDRMRGEFERLPFMQATEATIADALAAMKDEDTRAEWGQRGHDHAVRWHDGTETVARLTPVYRALAA